MEKHLSASSTRSFKSPVRLSLPDTRLAFLLAFSAIPLLFIPKISLIKIRGETAGLRIDDLILLSLSLFLMFLRLSNAKGLLRIEKIFGVILLSSFVSFLSNRILDHFDYNIPNTSSIIYTFRLIEYFLFFYIGY